MRAATADLHRRVDATFSGSFDSGTPAYAAFLMAMARGILPLEHALDAAGIGRLVPDWPDRRRADALCRDLAILGKHPPTNLKIPTTGSDGWLFGALYVLEGSRLGGKILLQRALAHPDPAIGAATNHLRHGTGRDLWPSFVARLEESEAVTRSPQDAVEGARTAFALFEPETADA